MKHLLSFLLMCLSTWAAAQITEVRINEVDPDQPAADTQEFIELFGAPNLPLDGLVIVFFSGFDDLSYDVYDLAGQTTNASGFFVLGSPDVPNVNMFLNPSANGSIQNGPDAIVLYEGVAASWPLDSPAISDGVVDAVVYGTNDAEDVSLITLLTPGQTQLDDIGNSTTSFSRVPDGGNPSDLASYIIQAPTPGFTNQPNCSGGQVILNSGILEQCVDSTYQPIGVTDNSVFGDSYVYILTDTAHTVLESNDIGLFDLNVYAEGTFLIWGASYNGTLTDGALNVGAILDNATASECFSLSTNTISIIRQDCLANGCNAGVVTLDNGLAYISYCQGNTPGTLTFEHTIAGTANQYRYFLTNANDQIYQEIAGTTFNVNNLPMGEYHLYGVSYFGNLLPLTIQPGDLIFDVQADGGCAAVSENYIDIRYLDCELGEGCTRVIISEYVEGLGTNKALELYNATPFPVDLADYDIFSYNNGDTAFIVLDTPADTLLPGETYVVCSSQADAALLALADNTTASMTNFNGNDAIVLTYNLEAIDIIGIIGDTVNQWNFGLASTKDHTLRRKFETTSPTTNWELSAGQWEVFEVNDFSGLGSHSAQVCSQQPYLTFSQTAIQVNESVGVFSIQVDAYNIIDTTYVQVLMTQGSATQGADFTNTFPVEFEFTPDNTQGTILIEIVDDQEEEETETFTLTMIESNDSAVFVNPFITVNIIDNDQSYPFYPISTITTQNAIGVLDSINAYCSIGGVVHGINFNPSGLEFTLIDPTDGIKVFSPSESLGYTPAEGDSVVVYGRVDQFQGMALFFPDSLFFISGGNTLETPQSVSELGEDNESHMVVLECVTLVDPAQWDSQASGFDVEITDGVNTNTMRIDANTDIFNTPAPEGHFTVVGIGAQSDESSPYNLGYRFYPRYLTDFSNSVVSSFTMPSTIDYTDAGATVSFESTGSTGTYEWNFGDGTTATEASADHAYSYDFLAANPTVTVSLTTTINGCSDVALTTVPAIYQLSVEETDGLFNLYPNPANDHITLSTTVAAAGWSIVDVTGRTVLSGATGWSGSLDIAINHLAPGLYHCRVFIGNDSRVIALIKN
jgi:hypothetical protein